MNVTQQLEQARADLAALERDSAKLQDTSTGQGVALEAARREARAGTATFEAVVKAQGRMEAARGLLAQHLQDVADARALVEELEGAAEAARLIDEGQDAHRLMCEARDAHASQAAQAEAALTAALEAMAGLSQQHAHARARLGAALRATVTAAQGSDPYGRPDRLTALTDRTAGREFLARIASELTEHDVLGPGDALPLPEQRFPRLARATGRA